MRVLPVLCCCLLNTSWAAITIGPEFWDAYQPNQQYSSAMMRDLIALREGDLLETAREIDGLELRVVGRSSPSSSLISARVVIDSIARERLQLKVLEYDPSPNSRSDPALSRRLLRMDQADALIELLEGIDFWNAPYLIEQTRPTNDIGSDCVEGNGWVVEAFRPGTYQLISRPNCRGPDQVVVEILEFLLGISGVNIDDSLTP